MTLQIPTPKPLAYIEQHKGPLVWKSYLVTKYIKGRNFSDFLRDEKVGEKERSAVTQQIMDLLNHLGQYRITHGDLKHTNILITDNGPVLTDLDAMRVHKLGWICALKGRKYIGWFKRSVNNNSVR
jgi:serine/threonine protein kinase